jgi:hypothetical protein
VGNSLEIRVHRARGSQNLEECYEVNAFEHAPLDAKPPENPGDVGNCFGDQSIPPAKETGHLAHSVQLGPNPVQPLRGTTAPHPRGAKRARCVTGNQIEHRRELDRFQRIGNLLLR